MCLAGLRGRTPEVEEILSFRSQICCFLAQKTHHGCGFFLSIFFFFFGGQNVLLAEIRDIAEKDIACNTDSVLATLWITPTHAHWLTYHTQKPCQGAGGQGRQHTWLQYSTPSHLVFAGFITKEKCATKGVLRIAHNTQIRIAYKYNTQLRLPTPPNYNCPQHPIRIAY